MIHGFYILVLVPISAPTRKCGLLLSGVAVFHFFEYNSSCTNLLNLSPPPLSFHSCCCLFSTQHNNSWHFWRSLGVCYCLLLPCVPGVHAQQHLCCPRRFLHSHRSTRRSRAPRCSTRSFFALKLVGAIESGSYALYRLLVRANRSKTHCTTTLSFLTTFSTFLDIVHAFLTVASHHKHTHHHSLVSRSRSIHGSRISAYNSSQTSTFFPDDNFDLFFTIFDGVHAFSTLGTHCNHTYQHLPSIRSRSTLFSSGSVQYW